MGELTDDERRARLQQVAGIQFSDPNRVIAALTHPATAKLRGLTRRPISDSNILVTPSWALRLDIFSTIALKAMKA